MSAVSVSVMGAASLLAIAVAMEPVARRLDVPLSLLLVVVGALLGLTPYIQEDALGAALSLSSEGFLYLFLPVLLFETAIVIDVRRLLEDLGHILLLAVVAVVAATLVVGFSLAAVSPYSLVACLLLASIVSTTDSVAVVALFKDLSVPHRLSLLVEGESLFNDAASIALFSVLIGFLTLGDGSASEAIVGFVRSFSGGLLLGFVAASVASRLLQLLPGNRMAEVTVTVAASYLAFVIGEAGIHVSGVVAVVATALVFAYDGRTRVSPETWSFLVGTWKQLGYWASALVFLLAALRIPALLADAGFQDVLMLGALLVSALAARGLVLFVMMPFLSKIGIGQQVDVRLRLVILWGGLRGAISLALVLAVVEHPAVPPEVKRLVATLVTAFVLFSLFVNGLTLRPLIRALGIDRLPPVDRYLRGRAIAHSLATVHHRLGEAAAQYHLDPGACERLTLDYSKRLREAEDILETDSLLSVEERSRAALVSAAHREQLLLFRHYRERIVAGRIVRNLVARAYQFEDGAKSEGAAGYIAAARREISFSPAFRLAVVVQRFCGWSAPLAHLLADRQESLLVGRASLHSLLDYADQRIPEMLGPLAAESLRSVLHERLASIDVALAAMRLQYTEFTETMQMRYLERAALRIEHAEYRRLIDDAVISREVFNERIRDIDTRLHGLGRRPPLDLKLSPQALLERLPFFRDLNSAFLASVVPLLRGRYVLPGETIIRRGERGREMYFLVSGAVEVRLASGLKQLGSGEFFGELALLTQAPRGADVVALGFGELLVMTAADFTALLGRHADLKAQVEAIASIRLAHS